MQHKAAVKLGQSCIVDTATENWSGQRSDAPRTSSVWPAWLDSRMRWCDTFGMIGVDEVGRGCLAGPLLVVAARQLSDFPAGLTDSKLLSRSRREGLYEEIILSCQFGEGWVEATEIDELGLAGALRLGVKRALQSLKAKENEEIVMDGKVNYASISYRNVRCRVGADKAVPVVSAASVYAKVKRDRYMFKLAKIHPEYGFESHVGYCTRRHLDALKNYGYVEKLHRQLYSPIKNFKPAKSWQPA